MGALRRMFGPSRKEIWRQLSSEIDARYVDGGFWKGDKVQATHDDWTVTLDTYAVSTGKATVVFTRMRAPYVNPGGFQFTVYRKGVFSGIGKMLGMQDIEIGDESFDKDFILKGNDEARVRDLLSNQKIRELIAGQRDIKFTVKDEKDGWSQLSRRWTSAPVSVSSRIRTLAAVVRTFGKNWSVGGGADYKGLPTSRSEGKLGNATHLRRVTTGADT